MDDVFITRIHIGKVRHLKNVDIELCENEKKHLILTGKNGSGKTSLLEEMSHQIFDASKISYKELQTMLKSKSKLYETIWMQMELK